MKAQRLLRMGIPELTCRGSQQMSKWLEQVGVMRYVYAQPHTNFKHLASGWVADGVQAGIRKGDYRTAASTLLDHFLETAPSRFFEGAVSRDTPSVLAEQMPESCSQIVAAAEQLLQGRFDLLGYRGLCFGDPVDWHLDPISGRRAPLIHWSRLQFLDSTTVGDSKVIWELNRHQWLVRLGQAYRFTGDERYAQAFFGYVQEWMRANPPGRGINWASSLEVALRLISWCWALHLFRDSVALSPELFLTMLGGIRVHATHVERYLSHYFSPNTHLTGEALGLFYAGIVFPELRTATRWREAGARILVEQIERQTHPDGVYFEQSTCYQRYTVEIYLHFMILALRNGVVIPEPVEERVQRMCDFLLAVRRPDGSMPEIGDADGGWLLPLAIRAPDDFRALFSTAAVLFGRSDLAWGAGGLAPETLWLLGPEGSKAFGAVDPTPPTRESFRLFADGGYVIMRNGWGPDSHQLIFDVGPLGSSMSAGHGHADLLSIQCSVFGEPCLVDPGTYCYTADPDWRNFFRSTATHSTVMVDGEGQAAPAGPFAWKMRPRARLRRWISEEAFDLADADHDAFSRLPDPVTHRRRVIFVKPRYWLIVDDLMGIEEHQVELRFQFAPIHLKVEAPWVRAQMANGSGLLIRAFATVPLSVGVHEGELAPAQGWVSAAYGQRQPSPVLTYSTVSRLPIRIVTLLLPVASPCISEPVVSLLISDDAGFLGLRFEEWQECVRFDDQGVVVTHSLELGWEGNG